MKEIVLCQKCINVKYPELVSYNLDCYGKCMICNMMLLCSKININEEEDEK